MDPLSLIIVIVVLAAATVWCVYRFRQQFKGDRPHARRAALRDWISYLVIAGLLIAFVFVAAADTKNGWTSAIRPWFMPVLLGALVVGCVAKEFWNYARLGRFWALLGFVAAIHGVLFAIVLRASWRGDWPGAAVAGLEFIFIRLLAPYAFCDIPPAEAPSNDESNTIAAPAVLTEEAPGETRGALIFEYEASADEYVACQMLLYKQATGESRLTNGVTWIIAGAFAIVVGCRQEVSTWATILLVGTGAYWAYSGLMGIFPTSHFRRCYRETHLAGQKYQVSVGTAGFEVTGDAVSWHVFWTGVTQKGECKNAFMFVAGNTIFIWGKRFLSDEEQVKLREFAGL